MMDFLYFLIMELNRVLGLAGIMLTLSIIIIFYLINKEKKEKVTKKKEKKKPL
jgi:hypothetical protein